MDAITSNELESCITDAGMRNEKREKIFRFRPNGIKILPFLFDSSDFQQQNAVRMTTLEGGICVVHNGAMSYYTIWISTLVTRFAQVCS